MVYQNGFEGDGESYIAFYPEQVIITDDGIQTNKQADRKGSAFSMPKKGILDTLKETVSQKTIEQMEKFWNKYLDKHDKMEDNGNLDKAAKKLNNFETKNISQYNLNSWQEFHDCAIQLGKDPLLTDIEKVNNLQKLYNNSKYKTDVHVPSDVQYIKGFSSDGKVIYAWPPNFGFKENAVISISRTNGLPKIWDRYGYMEGSTFAYVPDSGKYTYSERAIPYLENPEAYHTGTFNRSTYFDKIDAIKTGNLALLNQILEKEGVKSVSAKYFENLCEAYSDFITDADACFENFADATYGLKGTAASWGEMKGGAQQILMPINGNTMSRLGIIK